MMGLCFSGILAGLYGIATLVFLIVLTLYQIFRPHKIGREIRLQKVKKIALSILRQSIIAIILYVVFTNLILDVYTCSAKEQIELLFISILFIFNIYISISIWRVKTI